MARRKRKIKRPEILPDPVYGSQLVSKMINRLMWSGNKARAEKIFYDMMGILKEKAEGEAFEVLNKAIENASPEIEVRARRVGGATYQVPVEVRAERKQSLALRWIVTMARDRKERGMENKLASEILEAFRNAGNAVKKKIEVHKMAEANRAFAHLRW